MYRKYLKFPPPFSPVAIFEILMWSLVRCKNSVNLAAHATPELKPVLWIHDILVWIRIRGSMPLTYGSGSDPDPAIFIIDLQDANKKLFKKKSFPAYCFLKVLLHHFSKIKSIKKVLKSRNQGFSYYFCLMIEGSGS
jgi:hypothetical protein